MDTVCHKQLHFGSFFGKQITGDFEGGRITSDAGSVLLRELDERYGLTEGVAGTLMDSRHPSWVIHERKGSGLDIGHLHHTGHTRCSCRT